MDFMFYNILTFIFLDFCNPVNINLKINIQWYMCDFIRFRMCFHSTIHYFQDQRSFIENFFDIQFQPLKDQFYCFISKSIHLLTYYGSLCWFICCSIEISARPCTQCVRGEHMTDWGIIESHIHVVVKLKAYNIGKG